MISLALILNLAAACFLLGARPHNALAKSAIRQNKRTLVRTVYYRAASPLGNIDVCALMWPIESFKLVNSIVWMNERNAIVVVVYFFPEMGLEKSEVTLGKKTLKKFNALWTQYLPVAKMQVGRESIIPSNRKRLFPSLPIFPINFDISFLKCILVLLGFNKRFLLPSLEM